MLYFYFLRSTDRFDRKRNWYCVVHFCPRLNKMIARYMLSHFICQRHLMPQNLLQWLLRYVLDFPLYDRWNKWFTLPGTKSFFNVIYIFVLQKVIAAHIYLYKTLVYNRIWQVFRRRYFLFLCGNCNLDTMTIRKMYFFDIILFILLI